MPKIHISCNIHASSFTREGALAGEKDYQPPMVETLAGMPAGAYTFVYDYPLSREARIFHDVTGIISNIDLLLLARKDYEDIYAAEEAAAGNPGHIPGMLNRSKSEGPFGIWGHDFSDLFFEGVDIDTDKMTVEFCMGS